MTTGFVQRPGPISLEAPMLPAAPINWSASRVRKLSSAIDNSYVYRISFLLQVAGLNQSGVSHARVNNTIWNEH
jgi:hypothetical protein